MLCQVPGNVHLIFLEESYVLGVRPSSPKRVKERRARWIIDHIWMSGSFWQDFSPKVFKKGTLVKRESALDRAV